MVRGWKSSIQGKGMVRKQLPFCWKWMFCHLVPADTKSTLTLSLELGKKHVRSKEKKTILWFPLVFWESILLFGYCVLSLVNHLLLDFLRWFQKTLKKFHVECGTARLWRSAGHVGELVLSYHIGSKDRSQVIGGGQCLHLRPCKGSSTEPERLCFLFIFPRKLTVTAN